MLVFGLPIAMGGTNRDEPNENPTYSSVFLFLDMVTIKDVS
jgi:hypothetical protein